MDKLNELKDKLSSFRPAPWDSLPDIGLYMDQIMAFMPRQQIAFGEEDLLTPTMINNYVKKGVLPGANGKKYSREHLAYLTAICVLKQVISVNDIDMLLESQISKTGTEDFYNTFCSQLDEWLSFVSQGFDPNVDDDKIATAALDFALASFANKIVCERFLQILRENRGPSEDEKPDKKEKKKDKKKDK